MDMFPMADVFIVYDVIVNSFGSCGSKRRQSIVEQLQTNTLCNKCVLNQNGLPKRLLSSSKKSFLNSL